VAFRPSGSNRHSAGQENLCLVWNIKVRCSGKSTLFDHTLRLINPVHDVTAYFLKIHPNIILLSALKSQYIASLQVSRSKFCEDFSLSLFNPAQLHLIKLNDKYRIGCPSAGNFLNFPASSSCLCPDVVLGNTPLYFKNKLIMALTSPISSGILWSQASFNNKWGNRCQYPMQQSW